MEQYTIKMGESKMYKPYEPVINFVEMKRKLNEIIDPRNGTWGMIMNAEDVITYYESIVEDSEKGRLKYSLPFSTYEKVVNYLKGQEFVEPVIGLDVPNYEELVNTALACDWAAVDELARLTDCKKVLKILEIKKKVAELAGDRVSAKNIEALMKSLENYV